MPMNKAKQEKSHKWLKLRGRSKLRSVKLASKHKLLSGSQSDIVGQVRKSFGLGRKKFAAMTGFSERAIGGWEQRGKISGPALRKMREMRHLREGLGQIMQPDFITEWLESPNEEFQGATPLEVIERGDIGRIWRFIYYMESGMPI